MGFRFHRSIKLLPGVRLNFGKRGISASIGVRGAHVTYGPSGTRTTVGLPGSGLSYTHLDRPHHGRPVATAATATDSAASPGSAGRGMLWIAGLLGVVLLIVIGHPTNQAPLTQVPTPAQRVTRTPTQAADDQLAAQAASAALSVGQLRKTIANSRTLKLARVTAMPNGATCFQLELKNSRDVTYRRTAVLDGKELTASGAIGFTELWNRVCAHGNGRDITAATKRLALPGQAGIRQAE
jgi:hypothetical protein